jgi:hypothetical protein
MSMILKLKMENNMYQIRKCERVTICYCSEVANLDPEKFKNISIPFEGESEEDFLSYIAENTYEFEDIWDEFDEETQNELGAILEPEMNEYANSAWKFEDSWHELGKVDETWTKTGGFEVIETTDRG